MQPLLVRLDYSRLIDDTPEKDFTTTLCTLLYYDFCDNLVSVFTAANSNSSGRSKHVDGRHLKIRDGKHVEGKYCGKVHLPGT